MSLNPRAYQSRLVDKAIQRDLIVFLKTGSGKTFIATMLIKKLSSEIVGKYSEGAKRSVFVVNSVPLVPQQAKYIRCHQEVGLEVGEYYGEKVDLWNRETWQSELDKNNVLVMSAQILVDLIQHHFIELEKINLIIFDECHHATGKHPYVQILNLIKERPDVKEKIRYLGLTASISKTKCDLPKFLDSFKDLENMFGCKVQTSALKANDDEDAEAKERLTSKTGVKVLIYTSSASYQDILEKNDQAIEVLKTLSDLENGEEMDEKESILGLLSFVSRELKALKAVLEELGLWMYRAALKEVFEDTKRCVKKSLASNTDVILELLNNMFESLIEITEERIGCQEDEVTVDAVLASSSEKVKCLLDIFMSDDSHENGSAEFHSIVFVQRIAMARYLCALCKKLAEFDKYEHLKCGYLVGNTNISTPKEDSNESMDYEKQRFILSAFANKKINILFATNVVEEGIDVPKCNMIIRFNEPETFGSYYQSKGRARSSNSCYYLMVDANIYDKRLVDFQNFREIEEYLERMAHERLLRPDDQSDSEDDDVSVGQNDMEKINMSIPPYRKGTAQITAVSALSLVARYCNSLCRCTVVSIPPIYEFHQHQAEDGRVYFSATLRLPPNAVFSETLKSEKFPKKKWAKMQVSLDMCKKLDEMGEMNEHLCFHSNAEWASLHVDMDDKTEDASPTAKTGSKKHRNNYEYSIADEFKDNYPSSGVDMYLYVIRIVEEPINPKDEKFDRMIESESQLGFLSQKPIEDMPSFKLYSSYNQFTISFQELSRNLRLDEAQLERLKQLHGAVFNDMLNLKLKFSFDPDQSAWGCLLVLLNESLQIDWQLINSMRMNTQPMLSLLDEIKSTEVEKRDQYLLRLMHDKNRRGFYSILEINWDMTPLTQIKVKEGMITFKEHYKKFYNVDTLVDDQPMMEANRVAGMDLHFLNKKFLVGRKKSPIPWKHHFMLEHVNVLPLRKQHLGSILLVPSLFYRANTILRARKLCLRLENHFVSSFDLELRDRNERLPYNDANSSWDGSIKFNKIPPKLASVKSSKNDLSESDESETSLNEFSQLQDEEPSRQDSLNEKLEPPPVTIREIVDKNEIAANLPTTYHVLQCLTLKSANQTFDLERFEILGDCFLKLTVVLRLYCKFKNKKEGDLVTLKANLVSNKNLFKLALTKSLNEFIVADSFDALKWLAPFLALEDSEAESELAINLAQKMKATLSDKSLADCIEALIGLYLQRLGISGAKMFMEWLELKISKLEPDEKFSSSMELPDPLLVPRNDLVIENGAKLRLRYGAFQRDVLGYEFKNIFYLFEALTHPSSSRNNLTASYQRLELVGDAVIDTLITQYIFNDPNEYSPGFLTDLRQALVNNRFMAFLAIKYGFCRSLDYDSPDLFNFLRKYMDLNLTYSPYGDFSEPLDEINEDSELEDEIPKAIADTFESVAGAIYVDSNCSLETVWKSYYRFFMPYLEDFKRNMPTSPVKGLHELKPTKVKVLADECKQLKNNDTGLETYKFAIEVDGIRFESVGRSKESAKFKVFKKGYRYFKKESGSTN